MKTKEYMRGSGVDVISAPSSSDEASSTHSVGLGPLICSGHSGGGMDSPSVMKEDPLSRMVLTPTDCSSSDVSGDSSDDSDWEDIDDEDDDDMCILFQEDECDGVIGTNFQKDCFSRMNPVPMVVPYGASGSNSARPAGPGLCPKINGFKYVPRIVGIAYGYGSHHQSSHCWVSKLTQGCTKRLKFSPSIKKKVHFNEKELVQVIEFEDDDDSKQMRKLYWERFAVDRARFRDRVYKMEQAIGHVFRKEHRDKVYQQRIQFDQNQNQPIAPEDNDMNADFNHKNRRSPYLPMQSYRSPVALLLFLLLLGQLCCNWSL